MSSSRLLTIQNQLNLYGYPIFAVLGNIGNVFLVIHFSRQRQNACTIYIISSAIGNSVYLTCSCLIEVFPVDYNDKTLSAFAQCKLRIYILNVIGQIPKTMIVLAFIERFMMTNKRATIRAFCTLKRAKCLIFFSIIFWFVFNIHIPIMQTIINGKCVKVGIYSTIYTVYVIIFVGSIPTIIMSIFGYLTYRNMRQVHVQPIGYNRIDAKNSIRRLDRDLLIIIISEVLVYIVTATLFPLILLEMMISRYVISNKSVQYSQLESFILTIAYFLLFINSAIPFYIYLIASKSFSRDFKQLIINGYRKLTRQPPMQPILRTNQTLTQRETRV
jgi:hypothetical protein